MGFGKLIGAIDEGTTSARYMIFKAGTEEIVAYHQIDVPQIYPQEGWVEQDPMAIISIVKDCIENANKRLLELGGKLEDIIGVGITNQRESTVVWNRHTGEPLYNAIIWLDGRTSTTVDELIETIPNNSRNKNYLKPLCGLPLSTYFSALKLRWLKDNVPAVAKAMQDGSCLFGTIDTWLIYMLTGGYKDGGIHVTDVTNASRTMLMNLETLQWDPNLLKFFDIPNTILPEIRSSAEIYGTIKWEGLKNVPISACLGDQHAALIGQKCMQKGMAKNTYGTGCFLVYNTGSSIVHSSRGLLTTLGYQLGKNASVVYALEGSVAIAGAAISWLKNNLEIINDAGKTEEMARSVKDNGGVYFVPAFSGLFAPYWNQEARGIICGLSEETTSEHIVRATLEAVCFQVRDILDAMNQDCGIPLTRLKVDGGMTSNTLLLQMQADLTGINVIAPKFTETTVLGVALAAYKGVDPEFEIESCVSQEASDDFKPSISEDERNMLYSRWMSAVERSFGWTSSFAEGERTLAAPF